MSTTYIPFDPSATAPFQFQATMDGAVYTCIVTWNLYAQRWYIGIYDLTNTVIVLIAMVGSPPSYNISLTKGYFTTQLVYRIGNNQFEVIS